MVFPIRVWNSASSFRLIIKAKNPKCASRIRFYRPQYNLLQYIIGNLSIFHMFEEPILDCLIGYTYIGKVSLTNEFADHLAIAAMDFTIHMCFEDLIGSFRMRMVQYTKTRNGVPPRRFVFADFNRFSGRWRSSRNICLILIRTSRIEIPLFFCYICRFFGNPCSAFLMASARRPISLTSCGIVPSRNWMASSCLKDSMFSPFWACNHS